MEFDACGPENAADDWDDDVDVDGDGLRDDADCDTVHGLRVLHQDTPKGVSGSIRNDLDKPQQ